tara:strand:- start:104 stop:397 length:294 start_codon:yes stop_codon:yes gene_type:complete
MTISTLKNPEHFGLSGDVELTPAIGLTPRIESEEIDSQNRMEIKPILMLLMTPGSKISTVLHLMQAYQWSTIILSQSTLFGGRRALRVSQQTETYVE